MLSRERSSGAGLPFSSPEVGGAGSIEVYALSGRVSGGKWEVACVYIIQTCPQGWVQSDGIFLLASCPIQFSQVQFHRFHGRSGWDRSGIV
jgi:hypothetical protein